MLCGSAPLGAEITVVVTSPKLKSGMAQLEAMLASQVKAVVGDVQTTVNQALSRPLMMKSISEAATYTCSPAGTDLVSPEDVLSLRVGADAAFQGDTWDRAILTDRFSQSQAPQDYPVGAALQPLQFSVTGSFDALQDLMPLKGLSATVSAGSLSTTISTVDFTSRSFYAGLTWSWSNSLGRDDFIHWEGFDLVSGYGWAETLAQTILSPGVISQEFVMDPDGNGPLLPLSVTIQMDPHFKAGVQSKVWTVPLHLSTSLRIARIFRIQAGGGVDFTGGSSGFFVSAQENVQVLGYMGGLIDTPGSISLSGVTSGGLPNVLSPLVFVRLDYSVGKVVFSLPVSYRGSGLDVGLRMGVSF